MLALASAGVATCSGDDGGGGDAQPADAEAILDASAAAMTTVETAHFAIARSGADVFIDAAEQFRFDAADGHFARPSSAEAVVTINALGFDAEVAAVVIDGTVSITNPLTGAWEAAPAEFAFDPAELFDPDTGWSALLGEGVSDAEVVHDDDDRHHVRGRVAAERVATLTSGLVSEETTVDLWIDPESGRVEEVAFDAVAPAGTTTWRMTIDDYGADVAITQPSLGSTG